MAQTKRLTKDMMTGGTMGLRSRRVAVMLVGLALGGIALSVAYRRMLGSVKFFTLKKNTGLGPSDLSVETDVSFQFEQWNGAIFGYPSAPNTWHVEAEIINGASSPIDVLPIYMYSEAHPSNTVTHENSNAICPKSYAQAFSAAATRGGLTVASEDLSGRIKESVFLPQHRLDAPQDASEMFNSGVLVTTITLAAALEMDAKPVGWGKLRVSPHSGVNVVWEFSSEWAAPEKDRADPTFEVVHLGPSFGRLLLTEWGPIWWSLG